MSMQLIFWLGVFLIAVAAIILTLVIRHNKQVDEWRAEAEERVRNRSNSKSIQHFKNLPKGREGYRVGDPHDGSRRRST